MFFSQLKHFELGQEFAVLKKIQEPEIYHNHCILSLLQELFRKKLKYLEPLWSYY